MTKYSDMTDEIVAPIANRLMPSSGSCGILEGEFVRAMCKIRYRRYNDGDYWHNGYGCETAGPAHAFLMKHLSMIPELEEAYELLRESDREFGLSYDAAIDRAAVIIARWVERKEKAGELTPTEEDMLDYESQYQEEGEDGYY